ncbi:MAG: SGNH/GDSL hydrolase family protein, partial [Myxococcales bacterium]|nr:SGNH/GDSL hydrolase family protein [Myxococcales bacterium]
MRDAWNIGVLGICLSFAAAPAAHAARVVVFGDSWANQGWDEFAQVFVDRGHPEMTVAEYAVGGTTAEGWAAQPDALPNAVAENPDAAYVWLSIGGNDIKAHLKDGRFRSLRRDNRDNIRIMLDAL